MTPAQAPEEDLVSRQKELTFLRAELAAAQAADKSDEDLKKRIALLQKQIETQQKMIELLLDHVRKRPLAGTPVEKLQTQAATLEARSQQAARRDQDLTQAVDNLTEHIDAEERNGPRLPYTLKGQFMNWLPDISPLVITGDIGLRYDKIGTTPSDFSVQNFAPIFLYQLRENWLLQVEAEISTDEIELEFARLDWIVNDHLEVAVGRFLLPFGQYNERLRQKWINKLPSFPLVFLQVLPETLSQDGVEARGATYLGNLPVKFEYVVWVTDGFALRTKNPTLTDFANLRELRDVLKDASDAKAPGTRLGLVFPEWGIYTGTSYWYNPDYDGKRADMHFWGADFFWHWQSWDFRLEGVYSTQDVPGRQQIQRRGFYTQLAYRDYNNPSCILQNLEYVGRYSLANFRGIPVKELDLTEFAGDPRNAPVDRHQLTFGINYYFAPGLLWQIAYELNSETHNLELKDNTIMSRLVWAF